MTRFPRTTYTRVWKRKQNKEDSEPVWHAQNKDQDAFTKQKKGTIKFWKRKQEKKNEENCQLTLYAPNQERSIISKQKEEKCTMILKEKLEEPEKEVR
jgi:GH18 family chitinase